MQNVYEIELGLSNRMRMFLSQIYKYHLQLTYVSKAVLPTKQLFARFSNVSDPFSE